MDPAPPDWGDLRRSRPFSEGYGSDRGTPVDRIYIERFLQHHASDIHGDVLEVLDSSYTERFGTDAVPHILDIDPANLRATIIADLSEPESLPPAVFDCFILTQTLQYVRDLKAAVSNAWRAIVPGGTLLCSAPVVSRVDPGAPRTDRWRLTPAGLGTLLLACCPDAEFEVEGFGNLLTQVAFLEGLAAEELDSEELALDDPAFPLIACGRAIKGT